MDDKYLDIVQDNINSLRFKLKIHLDSNVDIPNQKIIKSLEEIRKNILKLKTSKNVISIIYDHELKHNFFYLLPIIFRLKNKEIIHNFFVDEGQDNMKSSFLNKMIKTIEMQDDEKNSYMYLTHLMIHIYSPSLYTTIFNTNSKQGHFAKDHKFVVNKQKNKWQKDLNNLSLEDLNELLKIKENKKPYELLDEDEMKLYLESLQNNFQQDDPRNVDFMKTCLDIPTDTNRYNFHNTLIFGGDNCLRNLDIDGFLAQQQCHPLYQSLHISFINRRFMEGWVILNTKDLVTHKGIPNYFTIMYLVNELNISADPDDQEILWKMFKFSILRDCDLDSHTIKLIPSKFKREFDNLENINTLIREKSILKFTGKNGILTQYILIEFGLEGLIDNECFFKSLENFRKADPNLVKVWIKRFEEFVDNDLEILVRCFKLFDNVSLPKYPLLFLQKLKEIVDQLISSGQIPPAYSDLRIEETSEVISSLGLDFLPLDIGYKFKRDKILKMKNILNTEVFKNYKNQDFITKLIGTNVNVEDSVKTKVKEDIKRYYPELYGRFFKRDPKLIKIQNDLINRFIFLN